MKHGYRKFDDLLTELVMITPWLHKVFSWALATFLGSVLLILFRHNLHWYLLCLSVLLPIHPSAELPQNFANPNMFQFVPTWKRVWKERQIWGYQNGAFLWTRILVLNWQKKKATVKYFLLLLILLCTEKLIFTLIFTASQMQQCNCLIRINIKP